MGKKICPLTSVLFKKKKKSNIYAGIVTVFHDLIIKPEQYHQKDLKFKYLTSWINFSWKFKYFSSHKHTAYLLQALTLRITRTGSISGCRFSHTAKTFTGPSVLLPHPLAQVRRKQSCFSLGPNSLSPYAWNLEVRILRKVLS